MLTVTMHQTLQLFSHFWSWCTYFWLTLCDNPTTPFVQLWSRFIQLSDTQVVESRLTKMCHVGAILVKQILLSLMPWMKKEWTLLKEWRLMDAFRCQLTSLIEAHCFRHTLHFSHHCTKEKLCSILRHQTSLGNGTDAETMWEQWWHQWWRQWWWESRISIIVTL